MSRDRIEKALDFLTVAGLACRLKKGKPPQYSIAFSLRMLTQDLQGLVTDRAAKAAAENLTRGKRPETTTGHAMPEGLGGPALARV